MAKPSKSANSAVGKIPRSPSAQKIVKKSDDYTSEGVKDHDIFLLPGSDYQVMLVVTVLAAIVRLFRIYQPSSVVFDEVHFGGFASKYIKGKFFMDVHPPLAKLLLTLAGWLAGFDGEFDFKDIGKDYLEPGVPYVAMRLLPAICGILLVPTMFLTLKAAGCRTVTAALGSCLIVFENGLLTQARLILLDSPLMIMTAFTALAFTSFTNQHEQGPSKAFEPTWWFWLAMTGLGLGATASVKWVGLFTIAWVGSLTVLQLWVLLGDYKTVTPRKFAKHLVARIFCLIVIPVTFYMAMFGIHFLCLVNPGDGDGFMSSEFQATLNSKSMQDVPVDVGFGSRVSIRHHATQGGYLHSHNLMYPTGSKQQQITLYPHKDENNVWLLENQTQPLDITGQPINGSDAWDTQNPPTFIKDGDTLKLYHFQTHRRLHSHDVRPPVTEAEWQNEVSAYGYEGFEGDANDFFRVEIIKKMSDGEEAKNRLRTIQTKFRLVHVMTGCVLFSHKVKLPDWASEQQEVTCAKQGTLPNSVWYIEQNEHPQLGEDAEKVNYRDPGFFGKFWELQKVMWQTNAGLVESHAWDSRPPSWPILQRGINFWGKDNRQIYLLGNPIIWWSSTLAVAIFVVFKGLAVLRWQRGFKDYDNSIFKRFDYEVGTMVLGWAFHYFPFYLMQRQLFLHHYFPALYFAIITLCQIYDYIVARIPGVGLRENPIIGRLGALIFLSLSVVAFGLYSPLAYGNPWTQSACNAVKLFDSWDFDCNTFLTDYSQYSSQSINVNDNVHKTENPLVPTEAAQIPQFGDGFRQPLVEQPQDISEAPAMVSPPPEQPPPPGQSVLSREEKVEYRDQDGNLLDEEQVKSLEGKVSFKTRYETRTRMVDAAGNEISPEQAEAAGVAPPHPDVDGPDSSTAGKPEPDSQDGPNAQREVKADESKEESVAKSETGAAKPASEGNEATGAA
ncbi:Dolichyl-phosphate-mannose--protein mannosyltransferase [Lachnellula hyalina]|uniref:Dolichyl-phosphate-mannose--protein mannosyltransferase n=1 Tax=Lachnellula hyalina TaxID=1316788 RepID=A0A8H8R5E9_9HELO|nr:Dolichyl-phosphate-mannose--protein mannosyltransferase [Lachnellula hyalina]TVY27966.1 Dolichyl-phosphate-mannose--protein mannosyltransferase [Lachnellula hyalina]